MYLTEQQNVIVEQQIALLRQNDFAGRIPQIGDPAPSFVLPSDRRIRVSSEELLKSGPIVLSFYPGTWCTFFADELAALADSYSRLLRYRARVIAISPQLTQYGRKDAERLGLPFPILHDRANRIAQCFGLTYTITPALRELCRDELGIDLSRYNGDDSWRLPISARFVIDEAGRVADVHADPDYRVRAEPESAVRVAASLFDDRRAPAN